VTKRIYSHEIGKCTKVYNNALVYIPKNASTLLRNWCQKQTDTNISDSNYLDFEVDKYYVLIRDPFDRWVSGVTEYYYRNKFQVEHILDRIEMIEFDEHTTPQNQFLNFDYTKNTVFVPMDRKGIGYLNNKFLKYPHHPINKYNSKSSIRKIKFKNLLLKKIQEQPSLKDKVIEFYKQDYEIIENYFDRISIL